MKDKIILILLLSAALTSHGKVMTLDECIRLGISRNLTVENARIEIEKGRTGVSQNRARLLPAVNGVFQLTDYLHRPVNVTTGTLLGNDFPDDPTWQTIRSMQYNVSAGMQLSVPLYNKSIYASIDVARTVERLNLLAYDAAEEELTMQIGKVYYLAQASLEQTTLAAGNISRMQDLCSITEAMYDNGVVMEVDLNRVRINLQDLLAQQDEFESLHARQLNMLRFLLDLPADEPIEVERMPHDIDSFSPCDANYSLPELGMAGMQKELTERKIKAVKAGYVPSVSLTGYAGALAYQDKFGHFFHSKDATRNWFGNCFIALNITVPVFDANSKKLQIRRYRQEARQAENRAELLRDGIRRDYDDAVLQADHNAEVYRARSESYRQACDVFRVTEEQYREGVSSMTSLLQDEMQLRSAQAARTQAHLLFNLARLELLRLSGQLSSLTTNNQF